MFYKLFTQQHEDLRNLLISFVNSTQFQFHSIEHLMEKVLFKLDKLDKLDSIEIILRKTDNGFWVSSGIFKWVLEICMEIFFFLTKSFSYCFTVCFYFFFNLQNWVYIILFAILSNCFSQQQYRVLF